MKKYLSYYSIIGISCLFMATSYAQNKKETETIPTIEKPSVDSDLTNNQTTTRPFSEPLVTEIYTADPSAHVFDGKLYIYPSHDIISDTPSDGEGSHFDMKDYHVLSMDNVGGKVTDHGVALDIKDVPWAGRQMWAPDAAKKDDKYYLYFPVKNKKDIFAIGVASSDSPAGPFESEKTPIKGTYTIDPSVFEENGNHYLYIGGIRGGQLQNWQKGKYKAKGLEPKDNQPAISPVIAKLNPDMISLAEIPKKIQILDKDGNPILAGDHERRFFEASWVHKYNDKYYFSYSTGDTHFIAYATGDSPYGPFIYQGNILNPVIGWTNHHSIAKFKGTWYLFYHDSKISGKTHLRNVKMTPLIHNPDGTIQTISPYK